MSGSKRKSAHKKVELKPILCKKCGHNMGPSIVRMATMTVRCGKCKQVHDVSLKPIATTSEDQLSDLNQEVSPRLEGDTSNEVGREELD